MNDFTPYSYGLFVIAAICFSVAIKSTNYFKRPITVWFVGLTLAYGIGALSYGLELVSASREEAQTWIDFQIMSAAFIPTCILLMSLCYQKHRQASWWLVVVLMLYSTMIALLQAFDFNGLSPLKVSDLRFENGLSISQLQLNTVYYIYSYSVHICVIASLIIFYIQWRNSTKSLRAQIVLIMLGTSSTWIAYFFFLTALDGIDVVTFGYGFSAVAFAIGLYRYQFIELIPIARTYIFEHLEDAFLIIDNNGKVTDYNVAALRLFPTTDKSLIGCSILDITRFSEDTLGDEPLLTQLHNQGWYEVSQKPIFDKKQQLLGKVIRFMDVSHREALLSKLKNQAEIDSLTGFPRRDYILQKLDTSIDKANVAEVKVCVAIIQLDNLRQINQEQGYRIADIRVQQFARTMKGLLPEHVTVGRLSDEQFLFVFHNNNEVETNSIISSIVSKCENQLMISLSSAVVVQMPHETSKALLNRLAIALTYKLRPQTY